MNMNTIQILLTLLNAAVPEVGNLIIAIKENGSLSVVTILDKADAGFQANVDALTAWQKANGLAAATAPKA